MKREYQALQFMGQHRLMNALSINGHWTVQLKNDGNFEGETPNPDGLGVSATIRKCCRSRAARRTDTSTTSSAARFACGPTTAPELGRFGSFTVAPIYRYNSAKTYSLVLNGQALSAVQAARNPGYAGTPTQQVFFGERGSQSFKGFALLDLAVTYAVPVWQSAQPWIKFECSTC